MQLRTLTTAAFAFTMHFLQALAFAGISSAEEDMRDQFRRMCEEDGGKVTISGGRLVCTYPDGSKWKCVPGRWDLCKSEPASGSVIVEPPSSGPLETLPIERFRR